MPWANLYWWIARWDQSDTSAFLFALVRLCAPPSSSGDRGHTFLCISMSYKKQQSASDQQVEDHFALTHFSEGGIVKSINMPASLCGIWEIISNTNFEGYMTALGKSFNHARARAFTSFKLHFVDQLCCSAMYNLLGLCARERTGSLLVSFPLTFVLS